MCNFRITQHNDYFQTGFQSMLPAYHWPVKQSHYKLIPSQDCLVQQNNQNNVLIALQRHSIQENQPMNSSFKAQFIFNGMGWDTTTMKQVSKKQTNIENVFVLSFSSVKVDFFSISYRQLEKLVSLSTPGNA